MTLQAQPRVLRTRRGDIRLPAFVPVTTFGGKYPLDDLIRPYLPRRASAVMVSHFYAKQQRDPIGLPLLVDSGGFASLFRNASVISDGAVGKIRLQTDKGVEE